MASAPLFQALGSIHTSYRNHHGCITRPLCAPPTSSSLLCRSVLKRRSTRVLIRNQDILITPKTRIDCSSTTQSSSSSSAVDDDNDASKCVLVLGGTGGVGQLVIAALVERGIYRIRAVVRDINKARTLFGEENMDKIQLVVCDTRNIEKLDASIFEGVTYVICCTGTTAFPSKRWDGENTPENTDWYGVRNVIDALPRKDVQRFVLVSSIGVTKYNELPWSVMNLFGVLKYKKMAEDYLRGSGIPYTIIRPGRLTDGPYTSYDLNTLLKATAGTRRCVLIGQGDKLVGEASRIIVAEACIQALGIECTCGNTYEINSVEGDGPGKDENIWEDLFQNACAS